MKSVVFEGNIVFSDEELGRVAFPFLKHSVTLEALEELRYRLTRHYVDKGYVNSGAIIKPDQQVDDGEVIYLIQEGRLDDVEVTGNRRLRPTYIRKRIWPDPEQPFNIKVLQERFQLLLQDPLIEQMDGRIRPGMSPGEAFLDLHVDRSRPYALRFIGDNHRPPSIGAERGVLAGILWNLTGFGDKLDASFSLSEGGDEIAARYTIPLSGEGTRLSLGYSRSNNSVIEEPLASADIESETETVELTLDHPVLHRLGRILEIGGTLEIQKSNTFLLGDPFSFTSGAEAGESRVTALRLIQSFVDRTSTTALALRSTFSLGVDLFGPTIHGNRLPDGKFLTWLGQVQYAQRLRKSWGQLIFRGDLQISEDRLLSMERFALGGANTVRGYRENELVRDNGYNLSVEWRYPLWPRTDADETKWTVHLAPFMDFGSAWNKGESAHDDKLHSIGLGLLWSYGDRLEAELYVAHALEPASEKQDYDFQNDGIHFRFTIDLL
ncbi:MAG: ShlB/FhaC/HecB family hemolysin secretion/activation protein [Desulfobacterales bacterium]|nr:ShlB/FhaC/HecB family hemolysin secretion/activation protein [Desulfobacterales bacterium]